MDGTFDEGVDAGAFPAPLAVRPRQAGDSPKSLRTRARILETAMRLFAETGYHPATNAVIAEASGLTRGAMLYHFASREALLDSVIPYIQSARARLLDAAAPRASLRRLCGIGGGRPHRRAAFRAAARSAGGL